jgi:hypothetical protein
MTLMTAMTMNYRGALKAMCPSPETRDGARNREPKERKGDKERR